MRKTLVLLACLTVAFGMVLSACKKDKNPTPTAPPAAPADTATFTATATTPFSPTPTPSFTITRTPTCTLTPTITNTPTVTGTPTMTFTRTVSPYPTCPSAPVSLGYTALGGAYPILDTEKTVLGSPITLAAPATVRWVGFYKFYSGSAMTKVAVYNSAGNSIIVQSAYALNVGTATGWYKVQIPPTTLAAGEYWVATWSDATGSAGYGHYDDNDNAHRKVKLINQPDFPADLNISGWYYQAMNYTLEYCP